jgi:hypothetical protein
LDIFWRQDIETGWRQVRDKMEQAGTNLRQVKYRLQTLDRLEIGFRQVGDILETRRTQEVGDRLETFWRQVGDRP